MNITNLQKTLAIVSKYVDPEKNWCEAQHDVIFLPLTYANPVSEEDKAELTRLGACFDNDGWIVHT